MCQSRRNREKKPKCPSGFYPALGTDQTSIVCKNKAYADPNCTSNEYNENCVCPSGFTLSSVGKSITCYKMLVTEPDFPVNCPPGYFRNIDDTMCLKYKTVPYNLQFCDKKDESKNIRCDSNLASLVTDPNLCYPRNLLKTNPVCPPKYKLFSIKKQLICVKIVQSKPFYDCKSFEGAKLIKDNNLNQYFCSFENTNSNVISGLPYSDRRQYREEQTLLKKQTGIFPFVLPPQQ